MSFEKYGWAIQKIFFFSFFFIFYEYKFTIENEEQKKTFTRHLGT